MPILNMIIDKILNKIKKIYIKHKKISLSIITLFIHEKKCYYNECETKMSQS